MDVCNLLTIIRELEIGLHQPANRSNARQFELPTLRTSIWQNSKNGWQMTFHQGTPTTPFTPTQNPF